MKRTLKGVAYSLLPVRGGWDVTRWDAALKRWVSYKVSVGGHGRAVSCTCPHHERAGHYCKHMQEVDDILGQREGGIV